MTLAAARWRACAPARSTASCSRRTSSRTRRGSSATCGRSSRRSEGTFLIGPMAKLGWGTPTLVTALARRHHRDPRQHRDPRRAEGGAARRTTPRHRAAGQLRRRDRVRQASASTSSRRCSTRGSCSSRSRARWACWSRAATTRTSCCRVGGFHPSFDPPPLPFPTPRRIAVDILNSRRARHPRRGLLRGHHEHGAVRRARRALLRLRRRSASRGTSASTRCSSSRRSTSSSSLGVGVAEGLRRRPVQHPPAVRRSRARRRGGRRARARSRSCSSTSTSTSTSPGARRATRRCRRSRSCRCCGASSSKRENWRALLPAGEQPARVAAQARPGAGRARAASGRRAARDASARCRST